MTTRRIFNAGLVVVVSDFFPPFSFFFFAILCSVIRKVLSHWERHLGGSGATGRRSPRSATDPSSQTVPVKRPWRWNRSVGWSVLKANERCFPIPGSSSCGTTFPLRDATLEVAGYCSPPPPSPPEVNEYLFNYF